MAHTITYASGRVQNMVRKYVVDTLAERDEIIVDQLSPGSTCFVIKKGEKYMLTNSKEWELLSSGSPGPSPYDHYYLDGGEIL